MGYWQAAVAKRIDVFATALHLGMTVDDDQRLDLSSTPPLGSPWDAVPTGGTGLGEGGSLVDADRVFSGSRRDENESSRPGAPRTSPPDSAA